MGLNSTIVEKQMLLRLQLNHPNLNTNGTQHCRVKRMRMRNDISCKQTMAAFICKLLCDSVLRYS